MGNRSSIGRYDAAASLHPSLARKESHRSTRSQRRSLSIRRISAISYRGRNDFSDEDKPAETIPRNIEAVYEIEPFEFQMQRNLCGCTNPKTRVDVIGIANSLYDRQRFVDRRIALHAHKQEVEVAYNHLVIHCYLTQQYPDEEHPNLVRLHGYFVQQGTMHVLTEYYPLGSLMMVLNFDVTVQSNGRRKGLPFFRNENGLRRAVRQLCSALAYLHEQGVVHLDLALENIFADSQGNLHLGDFAHAVFIGKINQRSMAAPAPNRRAYAAPELYSGREVDLIKSDSWSLGIILFMLLTKQTPMDEATTRDPHYRLLQVLGVSRFLEKLRAESHDMKDTPITRLVHDFVELLDGFLCCDPTKRLSVGDAMTKFSWLQPAQPTTEEGGVVMEESSPKDTNDEVEVRIESSAVLRSRIEERVTASNQTNRTT